MGLLRLRRAAVPVLLADDEEAAFTGAYDAYESSLAHVYEPARRTLTSYTGSLVRLRRDSDDAESDFGYDSDGDLDTAEIQNWLDADGASNAYGVTIFDQVGGDDVTQATKAAQPLWVPNLQNGHPGFRFDGSNHYLQGPFTNGGALSQPYEMMSAAALDAVAVNDNSNRGLFFDSDNASALQAKQGSSTNPDTWQVSFGSFLTGGASDSNWNLWTAIANGASSALRINAAEIVSGNGGASDTNGITLGANNLGSALWDGYILLHITFSSSLSASVRSSAETAINDYYAIY